MQPLPSRRDCEEPTLSLADELLALELELLTNATRKNAERVSSLLTDTFREFGSSGRVYSKADIVLALQDEAPVSISLTQFEAVLLGRGVAIVTYRSRKEQSDAAPIIALRSSIWVEDGDGWRMTFHQGTKLSSAEELLRLD